MHPAAVLHQEASRTLSLPVCDHYCGRLDLLAKSLALQARLGPVLDVTADCEDGARVGDEIDHVTQVAAAIAGADNRFGRLGVRPHPVAHALFERQVAILLAPGARAPARPPMHPPSPDAVPAAGSSRHCSAKSSSGRLHARAAT